MRGALSRFLVATLRGPYHLVVSSESHYLSLGTVDPNTDIVHLHHSPTLVTPGLATVEKTILIDLNLDVGALWDGVSKGAKYKINRATREAVRFNTDSDRSSIDGFLLAYDELQVRKGLVALNPAHYEELVSNKKIVITGSTTEAGEPISWHVYRKAKSRVRLMHTVTILSARETPSERSFAGRANRLHHWQDILFFKDSGFECLDLGGWSGDESNPDLISIDRFKENFGGEIVEVYNIIVPRSILGRFVVFAHRMRR